MAIDEEEIEIKPSEGFKPFGRLIMGNFSTNSHPSTTKDSAVRGKGTKLLLSGEETPPKSSPRGGLMKIIDAPSPWGGLGWGSLHCWGWVLCQLTKLKNNYCNEENNSLILKKKKIKTMTKYLTTNPKTWITHKELARENRKNPTYAEKVMWNMLRKEQLGIRFRRQQVIDKFIVDFISLPINLIIELDGDSHEGRQEYDQNRQTFLENLGYTVIRFTNDELLGNGIKVEKKIKEIISSLKDLS